MSLDYALASQVKVSIKIAALVILASHELVNYIQYHD